MYDAYHRVFERCGLTFRAVEARVGRDRRRHESHEFMAVAAVGEDDFVWCPSCDYAANVEAGAGAAASDATAAGADEPPAMEDVHTPGPAGHRRASPSSWTSSRARC